MSACYGKFGLKKLPPTCDGEACDVCEPTSRQDKAERRLDLACSFCPPNKGENRKRRAKHGAKKPRGKR